MPASKERHYVMKFGQSPSPLVSVNITLTRFIDLHIHLIIYNSSIPVQVGKMYQRYTAYSERIHNYVVCINIMILQSLHKLFLSFIMVFYIFATDQ
jgi:hypothetical protein